jgi:hypothetical protein
VPSLSAGIKDPALDAREKYAKNSQSAVVQEKTDISRKLIYPSKKNSNYI